MATDHISREGTLFAVLMADQALRPRQRDLIARLKRAPYLDQHDAADPALDSWWRAYCGWRLSPAVFAEPLDDDLVRIIIDLNNIASQLPDDGRAAMHALFRAVRAEDEVIEPNRAEVLVSTDQHYRVARRAVRIVQTYAEPLGGVPTGTSAGGESTAPGADAS